MSDPTPRLSSTVVYDVQHSIISDRPFTILSRPACACVWEQALWSLDRPKPKEKP
jgi:hypothetical protein